MIRRNFLHRLLATLGVSHLPAIAGTPAPELSQSGRVSRPTDDPSLTPLDSWLRLPIQPVWERPDLHITDHDGDFYLPLHLINAARNGEPLTLRYHAGSTPGEIRTISPALVFLKLHPGVDPDPATQPNYLLAWCHTRRQLRIFRVDRLSFPDSDLDIALP